jgi:hypothetical protein
VLEVSLDIEASGAVAIGAGSVAPAAVTLA